MAKMVLKTVEEINHTRKRTRLIFSLALIPLVLITLFMVFKAGNMYYSAYHAGELFKTAQTNPGEAEPLLAEAEQTLTPLENEPFAEKWVTLYNYGTVSLAENKNKTGIKKLEQASQIIDPNQPEICLIYANLAIGYEQAGDKAAADNDTESASIWYDKALKLVEKATNCTPPPDNSDNNETDSAQSQGGKSLQETKNRVQDKQDKLENGNQPSPDPTTPSPDPQPSDSSQEDKLKEIQGQLDDAQEKKMEDGTGGQGGGGTVQPWDKPW